MYQFKEGDKVRVVKKCEGYSVCHYGKEWKSGWDESMDKYIHSKEIGIVSRVNSFGITVDFKDDFWYFPSGSLELVADDVKKTLADEEDIGVGDIIECIDNEGLLS